MEKYTDIGFAKLDTDRLCRRGISEAVFCPCKTNGQLIQIFKTFKENNQNVIGTRASKEQAQAVISVIKETEYNEQAGILKLVQNKIEKTGETAVCTGGTGDIPIAEEAALTAEFFGCNVKRYYDVGIAGMHRLLDKIEEIGNADVIIAIAGMEGALPGVIAGMCSSPVIAVPSSIGCGASFGGLSALLTMLNSCAEGISVVNIDNGFGAGCSAALINNKISKYRDCKNKSGRTE